MATEWYFRSDGKVQGPCTSSQLKQLVQRGTLNANTAIRRVPDGNWVPASTVSGLFEEAEPHRPVQPAPPPLPPALHGAVQATRNTMPNDDSRWKFHGVSLVGWMVIAASLTIMAATVSVACVLIFRSGGAVAPATVVLGKAPYEAPQPEKPRPINVAESSAPAPVIAVPVLLKKLTTTEPPKPESKETQEIVAQVEPSVVTIEVSKTAADGTGSGFVIDASGSVVTNYHVIEGAKSARIIFHNGAVAEVLGFLAILPGKDLAILRIEPPPGRLKSLSVAKNLPSQGEKVLTFGAPRRLAGSVSDGIVSAIRKGAELQDVFTKKVYADAGGYDLDAIWIQITAPISPGNSGGPLVNSSGEVIGVSTWSWADGQNLNFAISGLHVTALLESGILHVHSLAELPRSREDIRDEEQKKRAAEEARVIDDARKAAAATLLELTRLNDRMASLKSEIEAVEERGLELTAKRRELFEHAATIEREARSVAGTITAVQTSGDPDGLSQVAELRQQYAALQAQYNGLDASARGVKAQIDTLAKTRDEQLHEMRSLQVRLDRLLRGQSPEAARDAATAKAWLQLKRGMKPADVEVLLGGAKETGPGPSRLLKMSQRWYVLASFFSMKTVLAMAAKATFSTGC
jgi:S1-C subfamily serine protease